MLEVIKNFVQGSMDASAFFDFLYSSDEMEAALMAETDLPQWANATTLYYYLIAGDLSNAFLCEAKALLGQYLKKNGVLFSLDKREEIQQDICLKALPDWIIIEPDYFKDILVNDRLTEEEKIAAIKRKVKADFKYLHSPPKWLQAPNWPFCNNDPLVFIGEMEAGYESGHTRVYVFFYPPDGVYVCINQSD